MLLCDRIGERSRESFRGCLLGSAVGDALGAPIEFMELDEICDRFGPEGVSDLVAGEWPAGTITDDTQMTLFTAEAMIRGLHRFETGGIASVAGVARGAYLRWLHTQGEPAPREVLDGWLVSVRELHARRAPGNTCLSALRAGGIGTIDSPANDSKGCGGVMRIAPVGLSLTSDPFAAGCEAAAVTHGHPTGYLAAGYLAQVVADVTSGVQLRDAVHGALGRLRNERGHEEAAIAVESGVGLAEDDHIGPPPRVVYALGRGFVADEALAMALFCALSARDFAHGVRPAVNHGGDSDSIGAIVGALLGLICGEQGIPRSWLERLELRDVITQVADDLWAHFGEDRPPNCDDFDRYPPT